MKKILKHLSLWDVKRKPAPRANGPPTETFIIYDESSSPSADDPPTISSARQVPPLVLLLRRDTSAYDLFGATRPSSLLMLRRTGYLIDADRSTLSFDPEALDGRLSTGYPL